MPPLWPNFFETSLQNKKTPVFWHRHQMAFHHFNGCNDKMSSSEYGIPGEKTNRKKKHRTFSWLFFLGGLHQWRRTFEEQTVFRVGLEDVCSKSLSWGWRFDFCGHISYDIYICCALNVRFQWQGSALMKLLLLAGSGMKTPNLNLSETFFRIVASKRHCYVQCSFVHPSLKCWSSPYFFDIAVSPQTICTTSGGASAVAVQPAKKDQEKRKNFTNLKSFWIAASEKQLLLTMLFYTPPPKMWLSTMLSSYFRNHTCQPRRNVFLSYPAKKNGRSCTCLKLFGIAASKRCRDYAGRSPKPSYLQSTAAPQQGALSMLRRVACAEISRKFPQEGKKDAEDQLPLGCGVAFAELAALTADCGSSTPPWSVLPCVCRATMGLHLLFFFLCLFLLSRFMFDFFLAFLGIFPVRSLPWQRKTHGVRCTRAMFFARLKFSVQDNARGTQVQCAGQPLGFIKEFASRRSFVLSGPDLVASQICLSCAGLGDRPRDSYQMARRWQIKIKFRYSFGWSTAWFAREGWLWERSTRCIIRDVRMYFLLV